MYFRAKLMLCSLESGGLASQGSLHTVQSVLGTTEQSAWERPLVPHSNQHSAQLRVAAAGAAATSGAACLEPALLRAAKTGTGALRACWGQRHTPGTCSSQHARACSYTDVKRLIGLGCTWLHYIFNGNVVSRSHGSSDFYTTVIIFKLCFRHC